MKKKKEKSKHQFLVGYEGDGQVMYGNTSKNAKNEKSLYAEPMTLYQAKVYRKSIMDRGAIIYKLVPVGSDE